MADSRRWRKEKSMTATPFADTPRGKISGLKQERGRRSFCWDWVRRGVLAAQIDDCQSVSVIVRMPPAVTLTR